MTKHFGGILPGILQYVNGWEYGKSLLGQSQVFKIYIWNDLECEFLFGLICDIYTGNPMSISTHRI